MSLFLSGRKMPRETLLAMALLVAVGMSVFAEPLVLNDFENEKELARFSKRSGVTTFALTSDSTAHGNRAARLVLSKWLNGAEEWPAIILRMKEGLPSDWSGYDQLVAQVHNESRQSVDLGLYVRDTEGQASSQHFTVPAGRTETLRYPLQLASNVNKTRIQEAHLFYTRPPEETSLVVDYLRLEEDIEPRLTALDQRITELRRESRSGDLPVFTDIEKAARGIRERVALGKEIRATLRTELSALEGKAQHQALAGEARGEDAVHRAGESMGERIHRELHREDEG